MAFAQGFARDSLTVKVLTMGPFHQSHYRQKRQILPLCRVISFVKQENTIRFQINAKAAEKAGIKISGKLLQIGKTPPERREQAQK